MSKILSLAEIKPKFDSQWILVANPDTNENLEIISGEVLAHSKSRDEIYEKARQFSLKYSSIAR